MRSRSLFRSLIAAGALLSAGQASAAGVYITEWMYGGSNGEFVEFTNLTGSTIDFSGWSFDDDSRLPGVFDLSGFGLVGAGESVVITETSAAQFRNAWQLDASVKVLGGYTNNLGRADEINLFANGGILEDRLTFGDQAFPGTIRTQNVSGRPGSAAALGANNPSLWVLSVVGDNDGAHISLNGDVGSPGEYNAVPVPAAAWLFLSGLAGVLGVSRRRAVRA
jgi:predicted extracellular nuclease